MHWHTWKFLWNTLGRAVEQLAGCLAKQAEVTGRGQRVKMYYEYFIRDVITRFKPGELSM